MILSLFLWNLTSIRKDRLNPRGRKICKLGLSATTEARDTPEYEIWATPLVAGHWKVQTLIMKLRWEEGADIKHIPGRVLGVTEHKSHEELQ